MKTQRKPLKQTSLFQYSSPVKSSSSPANPPSSQVRKPKKHVPQQSDGNDSDGLRNIRLERPSSDSDDDGSGAGKSGNSSTSSNDSDDDDPIPVPTPRRSQSRFAVKSESEEDPDNLPLTTLKSRGKKPEKRPAKRDSDEDDEDEGPQPKRRRLTRHKTIVVHEVTDEDSADDVEDLDSDSVLPTRLRTRGNKTAYQKMLEKYASRRKKGKAPVTLSSEEDEEDEEDSPPPACRLFKGAKPSKSTVGSDNDDEEDKEDSEDDSEVEEEDSWIVEDDPMAAPCLPAQFSMETHQDLGHQFKKVFQLFVHVAVQPPKQRKKHMEEILKREGDYFKAPLAMMRRKLDGLRDSAVASSVWRPDFKKALERFPEFSLTMMDFGVPGCDACHLGGRTSTRKGAVSGEPYNKLGFEPQKRSSSEKKADKRLKKQFDLGRFCAARTEVFHQFCHWEHDTFKIIERQVDELKTGSFCKIAYAGGRKPPKDLTDGDGILEWLDERGIVDNQWQLVKAMMDRARNLESEGRRGGDD